MKEYVLTESVRKRLVKAYPRFACRRCERLFQVGDKIISLSNTKYGGRRHYHKECYLETLIEA